MHCHGQMCMSVVHDWMSYDSPLHSSNNCVVELCRYHPRQAHVEDTNVPGWPATITFWMDRERERGDIRATVGEGGALDGPLSKGKLKMPLERQGPTRTAQTSVSSGCSRKPPSNHRGRLFVSCLCTSSPEQRCVHMLQRCRRCHVQLRFMPKSMPPVAVPKLLHPRCIHGMHSSKSHCRSRLVG